MRVKTSLNRKLEMIGRSTREGGSKAEKYINKNTDRNHFLFASHSVVTAADSEREARSEAVNHL